MAISITNTYSSILFELGKKHNSLKTYFDNANSLIVIINQNDVFKSFLNNNVIDKKDKKDILKDICSSIFDINFIYFLWTIIDYNRQKFILLIMNKFIEMCNEFYGIKNVKVITAKKLNEEQIQKISYTLKSKFQINEIYITNDIDETIIGGIKVILDNKTYDSTFKTKMQSMKETLYKTINQGE